MIRGGPLLSLSVFACMATTAAEAQTAARFRFSLPRQELSRSLEAVATPFKYRVVAGPITSPTYTVGVAHPPRVTRIDVDYTYPPTLGLEPRTEEDSGDVYAPAGTDVRLRVRTDRRTRSPRTCGPTWKA